MPQQSSTRTSHAGPHEPARQVIASFDNYSEAESAVDYLSDRGFAVERVAIIGRDVELVEQVLGRMNYGGAALRGALSGALPGALIGWLFGLFDWIRPLIASLTLAAYGLLFGAVVGAVCGLVWHALQRGRRDFASIQSMQPARYEIVADVDVAEEAVWMLAARDEGGSS